MDYGLSMSKKAATKPQKPLALSIETKGIKTRGKRVVSKPVAADEHFAPSRTFSSFVRKQIIALQPGSHVFVVQAVEQPRGDSLQVTGRAIGSLVLKAGDEVLAIPFSTYGTFSPRYPRGWMCTIPAATLDLPKSGGRFKWNEDFSSSWLIKGIIIHTVIDPQVEKTLEDRVKPVRKR